MLVFPSRVASSESISSSSSPASSSRIRFKEFYIRRLKRLGPALAVVSIATVIMAFLFLSPLGPQQVTYQSALGASVAVANGVIALQSGDYFGTDAAKNALLHTWSLSVEEQFYLVLPAVMGAVLWVAAKSRRRVVAVLPFVCLALLAVVSIYSTRLGTAFPFGYYGPLPRAWEFLAGALLALSVRVVRRLPHLILSLGGLVGVAAMAASFVLITPDTPFPGKWTILPVAGTVLALAAGRGAPTLVSRLLGTAPMVWIGDLSYSLYLWHWPFIVTAAAIWPFSTAAPVIAGLASVIPSYFTYRYVEQPFRAQTVTGAKGVTRLVVGILAPPLAVATAAWLALALLVQPAMAPGGALASRFGSVESADVDRQLLPCRDEAMAALSNGLCGTTLDGEASVLLIGDSHAEHLLPAFEAQFPKTNIEVITVRSPKPFGSQQGVAAFMDYVERNPQLTTVIYSKRLGRDGGGLSPEERLGMESTLNGLTELNRDVFVLDDNPLWPVDMASCTHRHAFILPGTLCAWDASHFEPRHAAITADLEAVVAGSEAEVVSVHGAFCDDNTCMRASASTPLYSDEDHLTAEGAQQLLIHALQRSPQLRDALG